MQYLSNVRVVAAQHDDVLVLVRPVVVLIERVLETNGIDGLLHSVKQDVNIGRGVCLK